MGYITDNNTLNPLFENAPINNPYGGNPGIDYEHMNSFLDGNKKTPVVRKVDTRKIRKNYKDPRSVSSDPGLVHTPSNIGYEPRKDGMYNMFRDLVAPNVEPWTMIDSENSTDKDIVYSAAGVYTNKDHGYSTPFSTPSINSAILETPTREGDSHPSVLTNRAARMRKLN